jgi:hypothetical protein
MGLSKLIGVERGATNCTIGIRISVELDKN